MKKARLHTYFIWITALSAAALHVPVLFELAQRREIGVLSEKRFQDCVILIFCVFAVGVFIWLTRRPTQVWALVLLQAGLIGFVGVPVHGSITVETLLLAAVFLEIGVRFETRRSAWLLVIASLCCLAALQTGGSLSTKLRPEVLRSAAGLLVLMCAAGGLAMLLRSVLSAFDETEQELSVLRDAIAKVSDANMQYQDYAAHVAETSSSAERKRITRDLHDVVGLAFTNIIGMMNAVIKKPLETPEEQRELYEWIRETSQTGLKNTRAILYELRAISEPRPSAVELVNRVVRAFRMSTNTAVKIEWGDLPFHLAPDHTTAIIHLVQEALVNSFRHGKATYVEVHFKILGPDLRITVVDNGRGGPTDQYGIGQNGILERMQAVRGRVSFGTTPAGYRVDASIPLRAPSP